MSDEKLTEEELQALENHGGDELAYQAVREIRSLRTLLKQAERLKMTCESAINTAETYLELKHAAEEERDTLKARLEQKETDWLAVADRLREDRDQARAEVETQKNVAQQHAVEGQQWVHERNFWRDQANLAQ